ncbi:hypothetical protein GQ457_04G035270 [Hibiscus cannabinus]
MLYKQCQLKSLNVNKTTLFIVGVSSSLTESIQRVTGFQIEHLPVHCLRVPLVTRTLAEKDCQTLLDKIRLKLGQWFKRFLSYAGRINQLCSRFFWKGNDLPASGAKVSWEKICTLKSEGGLGLKNIQSRNDACVLRLIKSILARE